VASLAEVENKGVLIIVGMLSLMMIVSSAANGDFGIAILFIILAIVCLKVLSSSKTDVSSWSNDPFQTINPMVKKQSLREETWFEAIKNLLGWWLVWAAPATLAWIYFLW